MGGGMMGHIDAKMEKMIKHPEYARELAAHLNVDFDATFLKGSSQDAADKITEAAEKAGKSKKEINDQLLDFWNHVDHTDVKTAHVEEPHDG